MFINKGNKNNALKELANDKNNSVAHLYKTPTNGDFVVTIKDLFATEDAPTQASSKLLENFMPGYDATVIKKLKEAKASIVCKTHMDELALGGTGMYSAFGDIVNPLDNKRIVGGSSSGSASTFTKNISLALASDTGDSVRLPASYVGVVGFKPSYGAISRYGMFPFASSLDTVSYFTHNVNDAIEGANILFGKDEMDMTTKEVVLPVSKLTKPKVVSVLDINKYLSSAQKEAMEKLIATLTKDGIKVNTVKVEEELLEQISTVYDVISFSEVSTNNANLTGISFGNRIEGKDWSDTMVKTRSEGFGRMVRKRMTLGAYYLQANNQEEIFLKAQKVRRLIVDSFNKLYENCDVLIYPTAEIAPLISVGKQNNIHDSILIHANFGGTPAITLPFEKEDGMPFGLSVNSKIYSDASLLSNSLYLEKIIGGSHE